MPNLNAAQFAQNLHKALALLKLNNVTSLHDDSVLLYLCEETDIALHTYLQSISTAQYILFTECVFALVK